MLPCSASFLMRWFEYTDVATLVVSSVAHETSRSQAFCCICTWIVSLSIFGVSASSEVLYENGDCMRIYIRARVMRLMSDRAYAYVYGRLYIYGLWLSR
jgi:hypothetical protein